MKIVQDKVFLQYPAVGEPGLSGMPTHKSDAEQFVDIDSHSGGYPYSTTIDRAHDFKTVENAIKYRGHFDYLIVREVRVTYEFLHECD